VLERAEAVLAEGADPAASLVALREFAAALGPTLAAVEARRATHAA
jgi:hypothetical protein